MAKKQKKASLGDLELDKVDKVVRANLSRNTSIAQTFVSMYSNDTQIQVSPWDIRLVFGMITEPPSSNRPIIEVTSVGEVRMSPQHAKKVALILLKQLQNYEENIGPIPLPVD